MWRRLGVALPSPRRGHQRGHPGPRSAAARGDDRALATGPGCVKPERAKAPQRTTTTTSHCRQRGFADALVSTSVDVYAHSRAVKAARAASSAPRGTAHAERDHKSGGAFSSARIAGQEAGWCIMMTFTELMHDLEASRTPKRAAPRNFPKVSQAGRSASFPLQIAQRCARHVNPRKARSYRVERWPLAFLRQNESLAHHSHTLKRALQPTAARSIVRPHAGPRRQVQT